MSPTNSLKVWTIDKPLWTPPTLWLSKEVIDFKNKYEVIINKKASIDSIHKYLKSKYNTKEDIIVDNLLLDFLTLLLIENYNNDNSIIEPIYDESWTFLRFEWNIEDVDKLSLLLEMKSIIYDCFNNYFLSKILVQIDDEKNMLFLLQCLWIDKKEISTEKMKLDDTPFFKSMLLQ